MIDQNWYIHVNYVQEDKISPELYLYKGYEKHFENKTSLITYINNQIECIKQPIDLIQYKKVGFFFWNNILTNKGQSHDILIENQLETNFRYYCILQIEELIINNSFLLDVDEIIDIKSNLYHIIEQFKISTATGFNSEYELYMKLHEVSHALSPIIVSIDDKIIKQFQQSERTLELLDNWIDYFELVKNLGIDFYADKTAEEIKNHNEEIYLQLKAIFSEEMWLNSFYTIYQHLKVYNVAIEVAIVEKFIYTLQNCKLALSSNSVKELGAYYLDVSLLPLFIEMFSILDERPIKIGNFKGVNNDGRILPKTFRTENGETYYIKSYSGLFSEYHKLFQQHKAKLLYVKRYASNYIEAQVRLLVREAINNSEKFFKVHKAMHDKGIKCALELHETIQNIVKK
ncbi:MAG: hypothetical protein J0G32_03765 [Alphaproteobacteria bacterium]|jgi:hypothetical protein|nr:hypothetical protein [Alphaproteobacteria bacterium]OJV12546.1 MAG: hypothetical protein BGO27_03380 [Alphaproteobacteria bacterium 33-17]